MDNNKNSVLLTKEFDGGEVNLLCYLPNHSNKEDAAMKVGEIEIKDVGGIPYLKLENFHPQMNIISGENGVGKTKALESIVCCFQNGGAYLLRKRAGSEEGSIELKTTDGQFSRLRVSGFTPNDSGDYGSGLADYHRNVLYFNTSRMFNYHILNSLERFPASYNVSSELIKGVQIHNIKNWFVTNELIADKKYTSEIVKKNIELAKRCFDVFGQSLSFHSVDNQFEIYISAPTGVIPYEYLSSGFKSCISILFGIIKEIEFRYLNDGDIAAVDFDGLILIDEIEIHLHPEWQSKICHALKEIFPRAQFFITTHSPHVIQSASYDEVIALEKIIEEDNFIAIQRRDLGESSAYGFQGWTVDEILTDVMGMNNPRGAAYLEQMSKFDDALDENNREKAEEAYTELKLMLHPNSYARKILDIQLTTLG